LKKTAERIGRTHRKTKERKGNSQMRNRKKRPNKREPERLAHGKRIHRKIQDNWHQTAQGKVKDEEEIVKLGGRKGRIDIFVDV